MDPVSELDLKSLWHIFLCNLLVLDCSEQVINVVMHEHVLLNLSRTLWLVFVVHCRVSSLVKDLLLLHQLFVSLVIAFVLDVVLDLTIPDLLLVEAIIKPVSLKTKSILTTSSLVIDLLIRFITRHIIELGQLSEFFWLVDVLIDEIEVVFIELIIMISPVIAWLLVLLLFFLLLFLSHFSRNHFLLDFFISSDEVVLYYKNKDC